MGRIGSFCCLSLALPYGLLRQPLQPERAARDLTLAVSDDAIRYEVMSGPIGAVSGSCV